MTPVEESQNKAPSHRWRRTQIANPTAPRMMTEDWTLVDESGNYLARIYDTEEPDIFGTWRWEISPFFMTDNQGSALTGTDARMKCEKRLAVQVG